MHAVVNTLTLSRPLEDDVLERMQRDLMAQAREVSGFQEAHVVAVGEDEIVLVILCDTPGSVQALAEQVGSPWIRANLQPYLAGTDRRAGPVVVSSSF